MPTGYTAGVADGTITTLKDFAFVCARALGVCISMRDDDSGTPIPEKFEPSDYHKKALEDAQRDLRQLVLLSDKDLEFEARKEFFNCENRKFDSINRKQLQRDNYEYMLAAVNNWKGAPEGIREFMLSQLKDSIKFDCRPEEDYFNYKTKEICLPLAGSEWYKKEEKSLLNRITHHSKEYAQEIKRVEERNQWLKQLRESLDGT